MNHVSAGKIESGRCDRFPDRQAACLAAGQVELRASCQVDRCIRTTSAGQILVGRADDGIALHFRNVISNDFQTHMEIVSQIRWMHQLLSMAENGTKRFGVRINH